MGEIDLPRPFIHIELLEFNRDGADGVGKGGIDPAGKIPRLEADIFADVEPAPHEVNPAQVVPQAIHHRPPSQSVDRLHLDIDFRISGRLAGLGVWPSPTVVVGMEIKQNQPAMALHRLRQDAGHLGIESIILPKRPSDEVFGRRFLPDVQTPGILGAEIYRLVARPIKIDLKTGPPDDDSRIGDIGQNPCPGIFLTAALGIVQRQQAGDLIPDIVPVMDGRGDQRRVAPKNLPEIRICPVCHNHFS